MDNEEFYVEVNQMKMITRAGILSLIFLLAFMFTAAFADLAAAGRFIPPTDKDYVFIRGVPKATNLKSVSIKPLKKVFGIGELQRIWVDISYTGSAPKQTDITVYSKNPSIAAVSYEGKDNYWIETYATGKATIVAACMGKSASINIQVVSKIPVNSKFSSVVPMKVYPLSKGRVTTFKGIDEPFDTVSYIDGSKDECVIKAFYDNGWVKVTYPIKNGTKTAYCYLTDFIDPSYSVRLFEGKVSEKTTTYRRSDLSQSYGFVLPRDKLIIVAEQGKAYQIIYPVDSGGWKMGWLQKTRVK